MPKVHLYSSPAHLPFSFARHFWLVIEEEEVKNRYEVLFYRNLQKKFGFIHINEFPYDVGLGIFPAFKRYKWKGRLEKTFTGETAEKLKKIIENSVCNYPLLETYKLWGPNSNTYIQWILDQGDINFRLPWNAIGKDFKI